MALKPTAFGGGLASALGEIHLFMFKLTPLSTSRAAFAVFEHAPHLCSCAAFGLLSALGLHPALRAKQQFQAFRAQLRFSFVALCAQFGLAVHPGAQSFVGLIWHCSRPPSAAAEFGH
jgi:hypothetical protein